MNTIADIESCEEQLRLAMLSSDVAKLDQLLSDATVFTDQNGVRLSKDADLSVHRSGLLKLGKLSVRGDRTVRQFGDTAIVCLTADLSGAYAGQSFEGTFAYTRVWHLNDGEWRVEAAHCSTVASTR